MDVLFIGMGYVGTTTALALCQAGHKVTGFDVDKRKIDSLNSGQLYFYEPNLDEMLIKHLSNKRLLFTTDSKSAIENSDIIFITVGTPSLESGKADLTYVKAAAKMIGQYMNKEKTVVVKSTVPVGTTEKVKEWIAESKNNHSQVSVAMNPEFLREGNALEDALYPDRIVIGSKDNKAITDLNNLYQQWSCPIIQTSSQAAEMIKYASNSFLATKISFINEIARLCDALTIDVNQVAKGMGFDARIGPHFLQAGLGYGGSCFPKDVRELATTAFEHGVPLEILQKVEEVNMNQSQFFLEKVKKRLGSLRGKKLVILGLSFKPHTDDIRESVSLRLLENLINEKAQISVHDPIVKLSSVYLNQGVTQNIYPYEAVKNADAILLCTDWPHYKNLDWKKIHSLMNQACVFDGRNMLDADKMKSLHFHYEGIGYS
ncbi:UDP-glucose dehydrogenase family protein [Bacillus sp. FJAT-44742]|uniref:UDP-glucose dehydrogenase family protein n=1 Tax=Bacillus sp. FJAT-44742 TaxID=2014005 RepID=UPI000C2359DE|nr:UDP-glucose/GDP-mannose dehydrogenase family protein [Bacillus sp. FJAT-44742]